MSLQVTAKKIISWDYNELVSAWELRMFHGGCRSYLINRWLIFIHWSYCWVEISFESENVFLVFLRSFRGSGLVTSSAAVGGGRRPLPVPRSCGTGPGAPPLTAAEVAQASHQSLRRNTRNAKGGGWETTSIWASTLYASQPGWSQHEDLVLSHKGHCHKMTRIVRWGGAFPFGLSR